MPLRVLISAVTLFGGHVLNRRPDRILHVFALLAILGIVYSLLPSLVMRESEIYRMTEAFHASALLLIGIALLSAALTWRDAKLPAPPALSPISRIAGVVVSVFGFILIGFATLIFVSSIGSRGIKIASEAASWSSFRPVSAIANLGGDIRYDELQRAPVGPHPLRGRILMAGQPVAAAQVELKLNGTFRSETLVTNKQGEFTILLPAGPWSVNQVSVMSWHGAPEDTDLLLFSEHEPLRDSGYYSRMPPDESPVRIELPMRADLELPTFELRPSIAMHWPAASPGNLSEPSEAPIANPSTDSIRWSPVPGATEYEIQLRSVERGHGTMQIQTVLLRRQSGTDLPLAPLPKQPQASAEPSEYSVLVYAFDADGKLLSQSLEGFNHHAFRLDGTRLVKEKIHRSPAPGEGPQYLRDVERLSLVHSLLEYEQVDAARAILEQVSDEAPPGRKAAMQGAIEAMTGNCAAAVPLLDQADREGGLGCAPAKYRAMCPSTG